MREKKDYLEKTTHGTRMFPVEYYDCVYPAALTGLPVHWHEEFEITYIREGGCRYLIDLEPYPVEKGDILFLPSGVLHGIPEGKTRLLETDSFVFHPDLLGGSQDVCAVRYVQPVRRGEICFPRVVRRGEKASGRLAALLGEMKGIYGRKELGYELKMKSLLLEVFLTFYREVPHRSENRKKDDVLRKLKDVTRYVEEHYQQQISVKELAEVCHFSEYYFMRFFRQYMNMTCVEYLNQYRLDIAAGHLSRGEKSVTDIALDAGFFNISYFNRVFKKNYGMTPSQYRRLAGEQGGGL